MFEALRGKVRSALSRARKRASEPGFTTLVQQLVDLGEYIKRFKPREAMVSASPDELLRAVDEIRRALSGLGDEGSHEARRALAAKVASIHKRIEDARALAPDEDEDHDAFVDVEEQLWDLETLLGTRS